MKRLLTCAAALVVAVALIAAAAYSPLRAQTYPTNNPTYTPNPTAPVQTIPTGTTSTFTFNTNGVSTLYLRIAGSPVGLSATVQGTEARVGTPAWTTLAVDAVGGVRTSTITAAGLYAVNVSGLAQVRLSVSALTSGATQVSMSAGGGGTREAYTLPAVRATYSAAGLIGTGATTHFLSIAGSATKTVRVTHAECSGVATAAATLGITAEIDKTADTVDAGTGMTATPHDYTTDPAATATVVYHTTSPTSGTLVGAVRAGELTLAVAGATPISSAQPGVSWDFGNRPLGQEVVLRGVAQSFSLNTSAAFGTGAAVGCALEWTEE